MRVQHTQQIPAGREAVFDAMLSADALRSCLPGCDSLEETAEGSYEVSMTVGAGAVRGAYRASVSLAEVERPSSFRMTVEGKGNAGTMRGEGVVRLTEDGGMTTVEVDGQVRVSGVVARVGQRLLSGVAKSLLGRYFECMAARAKAD